MSPSVTVCPGPAEPALETAIRQFNGGQYYACHETLEELWLAEGSDLRYLYQGILQVGIGLLHLKRGNGAGALSLLERGPRLLLPFVPIACGIDVDALLIAAEQILSTLKNAGLEAAQTLLARVPPHIHRQHTP
jgi:uncharacterized protein